MTVFLYIPSALALGMISYQDFRYRAISWYWLPVAALFLVWGQMVHAPIIWEDWLANVSFILAQLSFLLIYFTLRGIGLRSFLRKYIGLGDLLFFPVIALALPFPEFLWFYNGSLCLALICGLTLFRNSTIPLAGIQALSLMILMAFKVFVAEN